MKEIKTITLQDAKKAVNSMERESQKLKTDCSFCVMDCMGNVLILEKMDNASNASLVLAKEKAESSLKTFLSTKQLDDLIKEKNLETGYFAGAFKTAVWGGLPVFENKKDKIPAGSIGVSGGSWEQDEAIAKAGVMAIDNLDK